MGTRKSLSHGGSGHTLQLFDTAESLGTAASAYLHEGWLAGHQLLVVAKSRHWKLIRSRLERRGCSVPAAIEAERLTVLDAHLTLPKVMRGQTPDPQRFEQAIESVVAKLATRGQPLRIYAELVEILAEEGNLDGACHLEELWNGLAQRYPFALLCGYSAAHFADAANVGALQCICETHTRIQRSTSDVMGSWLHQRWQAADRQRKKAEAR